MIVAKTEMKKFLNFVLNAIFIKCLVQVGCFAK